MPGTPKRNALKRAGAGTILAQIEKMLKLDALTKSTMGASCGAIGGGLAMLANDLLRHSDNATLGWDAGLACVIGVALGAGAYGLWSHSPGGVRPCLMRSKAMFVDGLINRSELVAMKKRCLGGW